MAKDPIKALDRLGKDLDKRLAKTLNSNVFRIRRRVASQEFLHWKSGKKPVVVEKAHLEGNLMTATVRGASGWKWAGVHIGPPGTTTIRAKKGMLAIPTEAARKNIRGRKAGPGKYAGIQIFGGIVWGKAGWGSAKTGGYLRQHRAAGERFKKADLIPLFILKGSVVVRRRIIPAQLIAWIKPQFMADLRKLLLVK